MSQDPPASTPPSGKPPRGPAQQTPRCVPLGPEASPSDWYYPAGDPNIYLNTRCNIDCVFCSSVDEDRLQSDDEIRRLILENKHTVSFEGGEPTLAKDLPRWIRFAKENGARETILCTNAAVFEDPRRVRELVDAGLDVFNVNLPAHIDRLYDAITQTEGYFRRRVQAVRNIIDVAGGARTRLHVVVNKLNYQFLPDYARFVRQTFPEVFFVDFVLVKVLGHVKRRTFLVPKMTDMEPHLLETWGLLRGDGIRFMADGYPLCFMKGFEEDSIDAWKLARGGSQYINEKTKTERCEGCSLAGLCPGPRRDYLKLYGDEELRPSVQDPAPLRARLLRGG